MLSQRIPKWIQEGEMRGEAKTLLKLLNLKFGSVPNWAAEKVNAANNS